MEKVDKPKCFGKRVNAPHEAGKEPALPGPVELARQRTVLIARATVLEEEHTNMPKEGPKELNVERAKQLAWDAASALQIRICSTPADDLTDALAVAECMHGLIESLPPSGTDQFSGDRDRALEDGIMLILDALIEAGADTGAFSELDAECVREQCELLRLVNGGDRVQSNYGSLSDDPVFAIIERMKEADAEVDRLLAAGKGKQGDKYSSDVFGPLVVELVRTMPTTAEGFTAKAGKLTAYVEPQADVPPVTSFEEVWEHFCPLDPITVTAALIRDALALKGGAS